MQKNTKKKVLARPNMSEKKFDQINNSQWTFEKKKKEGLLLSAPLIGKY